MKPINLLFALILLAVPVALGQGLPEFSGRPAPNQPPRATLGEGLPDLGDPSQSALSPAEEQRLGERIMLEIRDDRNYSDDTEVTDYLNLLGNKLVAASPQPQREFHFFLILDPQINAFALPGGYIGVNSGLLMLAQSESELAGVLSHEIGHVVQGHFARMLVAQKQSQLISLAALAVGILAARANSQISQAAIIGSQAGYIQSSLNFTRANELEADRVGFQILEKSGFDPEGMPGFFGRLLRATTFLDSAAPSYLRTHPLTTDRISDMQNRMQNVPYRQVPDSLEFQLMSAKLKAAQGSPQESVTFFEESLKERKYLSEAASRYGLVAALVRVKAYARAIKELQALRNVVRPNPTVEALAARVYRAAGDNVAALQIYRDALKNYPGYRALVYDYADTLLRNRQPEEALNLVESRLQYALADHQLYQLQAQSYAALNKPLLQHRALAESYYRLGNIPAAIEQLVLAQKSGGGDFYQQSSVDARLRQLRSIDDEMRGRSKDSRK